MAWLLLGTIISIIHSNLLQGLIIIPDTTVSKLSLVEILEQKDTFFSTSFEFKATIIAQMRRMYQINRSDATIVNESDRMVPQNHEPNGLVIFTPPASPVVVMVSRAVLKKGVAPAAIT